MRVIRRAIRASAHSGHGHKPAAKRPTGPRSGGIAGGWQKTTAAKAPIPSPVEVDPIAVEEQLSSLREWAEARQSDPPTPIEGDEVTDLVEEEPPPPSVRDRPATLADMVGQADLVGQLRMTCAGATLRGTPVPHILISGPAGFGKTSIAGIISEELGYELVTTTGMMLKKTTDLVGLLVKINEPTVLFIDEIHAMAKPVQEQLYTVLEDCKLDLLGGSGMDTVAYTHQMHDLVVVGATTRPGLLTVPFRDRFGFQGVMAAYSEEELGEIVARAWTRVGVGFDDGEQLEVARRCKGVPRKALHLAERVLDYAAVYEAEAIGTGMVHSSLSLFGIDAAGLDETDFKILKALTEDFAGKNIGLDALSQFLDIDAKTLQENHEPYLARMGLVVRAKSGRMASAEAYELMKELDG